MSYDPQAALTHADIRRIVQSIEADLNDRQGFDLGALDSETRDEILATWEAIILARGHMAGIHEPLTVEKLRAIYNEGTP